MYQKVLKGFISALLLMGLCPAMAQAKLGSLSLDLDAAKNYLAIDAAAGLDMDTKLLNSIDITYEGTSSGPKGEEIRTTALDFGLGKDWKFLSLGLDLNYGNDDQTRLSLGGKLSLASSWTYAPGYDAVLIVSAGPTRFSASKSLSDSTAVQQAAAKADTNTSEAITQWSPSVQLALDFFNSLLNINGSFTKFRYQDYTQGSGLAGSATQSDAAAIVNNTLINGFVDWEWAAGASLKRWNFTLTGLYSESLDLDTQHWTKSLQGTLARDFGEHCNALLGLTHATEGGSGDNLLQAGLTYNF